MLDYLFTFSPHSFPPPTFIMKLPVLKGVLAGLGLSRAAQGVCSTNLLIDNYANYANNRNSLGQWTSGKHAIPVYSGLIIAVNMDSR